MRRLYSTQTQSSLVAMLAVFVTTLFFIPSGAYAQFTGLSGTWEGSLTTKPTGDCPFDPAPQPVIMTWEVSDSGSVTIDQVQIKSIPHPERWEGQLTRDTEVTLTKTRTMGCFGAQHTSTATFTGKIEEVDGVLTLVMRAEEVWCPEQNCTARSTYTLRKTGEN
jgi:hypothetical protein